MTEMLLQRGKVQYWKPKHGYGFIRPENGTQDVFCHFTAIESQARRRDLVEDQFVEFEVSVGPKGPYASRVKVIVP